jgi:hypothetical protein
MATMRIERTGSGWRLWFQWVLASMLGFGVGAAIAGFIPSSITSLTCAQSSTDTFIDRLTNYQCNLQTLVLLSMVIILGLTGGFMQWLVLRSRIPGTGWWVPASTLNFPAVPAVANGALILGGGVPSPAPILLGSLVAILSGILPWFVLHRRLARAGWWIPAHWLGSLVAVFLGVVGFHAAGLIGLYQLSWAAAGAMFGAGLGAITGITLVWLLRQPLPDK